ncbi:sigma-54-dependent transcriptional regulator [Pseudodesulfovibrio senegalensis]|jgi:two-component system NtrC family response regulator|uniref:Sigma-54-dependent Fis family transcriptional regulator n=1 Tax=Pseudodesulfovibrio senegalensis TaxID=1721087 RepID=A0A6N6N1E4_9BACT|nr:sigma-54 dependent transcriptional regulator [Pseudodesulfovibrio senegalensis]KAB1441714.1 sigma-54-dependent Fis family transcriptional regulator [Pseudodesulfovibrio senegalensis]
MPANILILDDEKNYLLILESILEEEGYEVTALSDPEMGLAYLEDSEVDVVLTDMKMPKLTGNDVLEHVKKKYPHIPVLIMTAFGSVESAVEAMRIGAFDYITKPFANEELLLSISKAVSFAETQQDNLRLRRQLQEKFGSGNIIARGKGMREVLEMVNRAAPSKSTVLVMGESGTGKELIARAIHDNSPRKSMPFVSVNCMALNPGVLESELFGHEKGSFTGATALRKGRFEQASKGTLFLDEIGELTPELQVKLLRVLQEHQIERVGGTETIDVDIRIVAATNKNLQEAVSKGEFREDLFYRLNVVSIFLPPLRERREDIPFLADHFLDQYSKENEKNFTGFTAAAMDYLSAYEWPGNVRQLENVIERCTVLGQNETIDTGDLPPEIKDEESQFKSAVDLLPARLNLADTMDKIEAALVRRALVRAEFVQVKAAEMLGLSKSNLQYKLKKYGLLGKAK